MPSPFPGMNPYLEQDDVWQDFHQSFITRTARTSAGTVSFGIYEPFRLTIQGRDCAIEPKGRRLLWA